MEGNPSPIGDNSWREGCLPNGTIVLIVHGYNESIETTPWIKKMIHNFLELHGGCVFFMDYSNYSSANYFDLLIHFDRISSVLKEKLLTLDDPKDIQMFGFSFGARLAIDAALLLSMHGRKIDKIFACDPARPGFDFYLKNPQNAAHFVQCINTSIDKGTNVYNCHQNWRFVSMKKRQTQIEVKQIVSGSAIVEVLKSALKVHRWDLTVFALTSSMNRSTSTSSQTTRTSAQPGGRQKTFQATIKWDRPRREHREFNQA